MKTISTFYNPKVATSTKSSGINFTSLLSWVVVLFVIMLFWSGAAAVYKSDSIPHAIAKIEHKERKFLASHKTLQKKLIGIRSVV